MGLLKITGLYNTRVMVLFLALMKIEFIHQNVDYVGIDSFMFYATDDENLQSSPATVNNRSKAKRYDE